MKPSLSHARGRFGRPFSWKRVVEAAMFGLLIAAIFAILYSFISNYDWDFGDWSRHYRPAARDFWDPYHAKKDLALANPPWLLWILAPLALFPVNVGLAAWMIITILLSVWCIRRLGGDFYTVMLCLLTPPFMRVFAQGQIDALVLAGFTLTMTAAGTVWKSIGYILMSIKPNVLGLGAIISWIKLGTRDKIVVAIALMGITVLSILLIGFWPRYVYETVTTKMLPSFTGIRIWPYGVPVGLVLLGWSLHKRNEKLAALSTFFLVPYIGIHSMFPYLAVLFTAIPKLGSTAIFIALWAASLYFI